MTTRTRVLAVAAAVTALGTAPAQAALPRGDDPVRLDPADFTTRIDNRYLPLRPGTRWRYREVAANGERQDVVVTATRATRRIANGITARVVRDTVVEDGAIVEDTFDWYAQDDRGTVWYLGEDTAEFEGGELASREGSFEAGVGGALPGVAMPARPRAGQRYRQEYAEGVAEDNGAVLATRERVQVPAGRFRRAVLTRDTNALEPDALEYKLYAPGVGPVLEIEVSGGPNAVVRLVERDRAPAGWLERAARAPLGQGPT